jgi:hypothetical protein
MGHGVSFSFYWESQNGQNEALEFAREAGHFGLELGHRSLKEIRKNVWTMKFEDYGGFTSADRVAKFKEQILRMCGWWNIKKASFKTDYILPM